MKEDASESDYQKALMDMYYCTPNRKKQDVVDEAAKEIVEEDVVDEPIHTPINEEVTSEVPKKQIQKPTFLNRLLNTLGDMVEKID